MANPTTNYGFVLPTPTDLVTDLPADFDVALQGVDTRLKALQPGTTLGDLAYSSATANTNTRLPIGTTGQVLAVSGGVPAWTTTADVTPLTTKGDLFTFTTVDARIGVGANNTVLTADSSQATGLKWATPSSGALTLVTQASFSAVATTGTTFDGVFTSTYKNYMVVLEISGSSNGAELMFRLRSGTTTLSTNYGSNRMLYNGATQTNSQATTYINPGAIYSSGNNSNFTININPRRSGSGAYSVGSFLGYGIGSGGMAVGGFEQYSAAPHDGFILENVTGTCTGQAWVYGLAVS